MHLHGIHSPLSVLVVQHACIYSHHWWGWASPGEATGAAGILQWPVHPCTSDWNSELPVHNVYTMYQCGNYYKMKLALFGRYTRSAIHVIFTWTNRVAWRLGLCVRSRSQHTDGSNGCHAECLKRTVMQTTLNNFIVGGPEEAHQSSANSLRVYRFDYICNVM